MNHQARHDPGTAIGRFLESADRFPERIALEKGREKLTYRELREASLNMARMIEKSRDDRPFTAVMGDKSLSCYAAILGILLAGKGYVPLNPRFPESRNRLMMERAGVSHLFRDGQLAPISTSPVAGVRPDPAYLLFTSGTTGEPKGVQISHGNLAAYLDFMLKSWDFNPGDRFTQNFDLTFDLSVHDMFLCWSAGACLCVPEEASSFSMAGFIREKQPTTWFSVPSVVTLMERMRLLNPGAFPSIRLSFFCGEPLYLNTVSAWSNALPNARIINLYGPTETTIAITRYEIPASAQAIKHEMGIVSIGKIFERNDFRIVSGELCLSGAQVMSGYFKNPEADRQSFHISRKDSGQFYRTGDLVKMDNEGDLFYLGRLDSEVKILGYRVNLKEIENQINAYHPVDQCVVIYDTGYAGQDLLTAFLTVKSGGLLSEQEMDAFCRRNLPWYMVPGKYIFVKEFPVNINGKIDKAALKEIFLHG